MTMAGMAEVLAAHQKYGMGMSGDSPDTCKCRAKIYPAANDGYIEDRRDNAFADHVADELTKAGYGSLQETKGEAIEEAVSFLRDRSKWARSEHGPYVVKTGYDTDGWGHASQDVDEWYADWLEQFPYRNGAA